MKKSERKTENKIVRALHSVCDALLVDTAGFCWLTHFVDYSNVPQSLRIVCVFDTIMALKLARDEEVTRRIAGLADDYLQKEGLFIPQIEKAVFLDTEENGADVGSSRWCRKFSYER